MNQETKTCQNCKKNFVIESDDFDFYEKISVPAPTFCPECRLQRRYAWRNIRSIYKRKCDLCDKEAIGVYSPDKPFKVYCSKCWWSDKWDAVGHGRDYDFSRPFFEQFYDLLKTTPLLNRFVYEETMVRSDYTNMARDLKDCYLIFHGNYCERCLYSDQVHYSNDCVDVSYVVKSELCYESVNLQKCNRVFFSKDSKSCHDCYFINNCIGCSNCFGCTNLRNQQYHIFNKPYSKDDYFLKLTEMGFNSKSALSVENFKKKARTFWLTFPLKYIHGTHNSNVSGDYIFNSKNTYSSFHVKGLEDSKFCAHLVVPSAKDCYDWTQYGENGELIYEALQAGEGVYNDKFGWCIWRHSKNIEYSVLTVNSSDCLGCVSIKNKQHCILNKQYSEKEYEELRKKIITHISEKPFKDKKERIYKYGEFFPITLSPFGYNETSAQETFPLTESAISAEGYNFADVDKYRGKYEITKSVIDLPDNIDDVKNDILEEVIGCQECGRAYKIIEPELEFYRHQSLPLPRSCFECLHKERFKDKNPDKLYHRKCLCNGQKSENAIYANALSHFHGDEHCPNEFETSYAPDRPDIVYCEECYLKEVV